MPADRLDFYIARIALLWAPAILFNAISIIQFLVRCPAGSTCAEQLDLIGWGWSWNLSIVLFYQIVLGGSVCVYNGPTWSLLPMTSFLLLFPFIDTTLRSFSNRQLFGLMFVSSLTSCTAILTAARLGRFWLVYSVLGFVYWIPCFCLGAASARIFMYENPNHNKKFWAGFTDVLTVSFVVVLIAAWFNPCHMSSGTALPVPVTRWTFLAFDKPTTISGTSCNQGDFEMMISRPASARAEVASFGVFSPRLDTLLAFLSWFQLGTPFVALWVYGLAVGRGRTAAVLSTPLLAEGLAPLAYGVYLSHVPIGWGWYFVTQGVPAFEWWHELVPIHPLPLDAVGTVLVLVLSFLASWLCERHLNTVLIARLTRLLHWMLAPNACSRLSEDDCRLLETRKDDDQSAASHSPEQLVQRAIRRVTGARVHQASSLQHIGLDSFGRSALVGLLRGQLPQARHLTIGKLHEL